MTNQMANAASLISKVPLDILREPFYEGSVQRLYEIPDEPDYMVTETSAGGSVFDVGTIFSIEGSDVARAVFRHVLYSGLAKRETWQEVKAAVESAEGLDNSVRKILLEGTIDKLTERGAITHHCGMVDALSGEVKHEGLPENESAYNIVRRYKIEKPEPSSFLRHSVYDYSKFRNLDRNVVPLECIVRFGITSGSSVFRKYLKLADAQKRNFERELGSDGELQAWQYLATPIVDFTSKYEPEDRAVTKQEALNMSGLDAGVFNEMGKLAVLGGWAVRVLVEKMGLQLWDLKWEFARDGEDLVFVDTIDTDSFRATSILNDGGQRFVIHYNKQAMRDYYKIAHAGWLAAVGEAKQDARAEGVPFVDILRSRQASGDVPEDPQVDSDFLAIQVKKMDLIKDCILGRRDGSDVRQALEDCGKQEVAFYTANDWRGQLSEINGLD
jgi:phosphoribosylaminoimidazole-succinocarboxamide synthase